MPFWTYQNLAAITQGTWLVPPEDVNTTLPAASDDLRDPVLWHDTRDLKPGQAYLAIAGDNFDGHAFVDQAFDAGAALAIVQQNHQSSIINHQSNPILQVADTVKALQDLARAYRDELKTGGCKVIGIAGSNGKTTTRHLIHHVLTHAGLTGTQSPKSFNNHLGVPLTLLSAKPSDDFVACEIGTNHPGEIDFLSAIARPDVAVITSIGEEHLEFFKTIRGVAEEEAAIIQHIVLDGSLVCPEYDWDRYLKSFKQREDLQIAHEWYVPESDQTQCRLLELPSHIRTDISLAGCIAISLGVAHAQIDEAMLSAKVPSGRGERIKLDQVTIIHDAYNANPSSVVASLEQLLTSEGRNVFIFGDMFELGESSIDAHRTIGMRLAEFRVKHLITIGTLARHAAHSVDFSRTDSYGEWSEDLPDQVAALLEPGDTVLLKASRGMRLERLIPAIERRFGPRKPD